MLEIRSVCEAVALRRIIPISQEEESCLRWVCDPSGASVSWPRANAPRKAEREADVLLLFWICPYSCVRYVWDGAPHALPLSAVALRCKLRRQACPAGGCPCCCWCCWRRCWVDAVYQGTARESTREAGGGKVTGAVSNSSSVYCTLLTLPLLFFLFFYPSCIFFGFTTRATQSNIFSSCTFTIHFIPWTRQVRSEKH